MRPFRLPALLALLAAVGCTDDYQDSLPESRRGVKRDVCPGNDCFGMHSYSPPGTCEACGAQGIAAFHWLCTKCAAEQGRCPHCAGELAASSSKTPPRPPSEPQTPQPPLPPPPPAPPRAPEPRKPEEPKESKAPVDFNLDDVRGDKLTVHEEKEPKGREKLEHELIVYACLPAQFNEQLRRHLAKKEGSPLHKPDDDLVLYVLWGDRLGDPQPQAIFDRKTRRIVVTAKWAGQGLMDTGTLYRGYGLQLGKLEAGEYRVWVRESTPVDKDGPKLTKSYSFRVER